MPQSRIALNSFDGQSYWSQGSGRWVSKEMMTEVQSLLQLLALSCFPFYPRVMRRHSLINSEQTHLHYHSLFPRTPNLNHKVFSIQVFFFHHHMIFSNMVENQLHLCSNDQTKKLYWKIISINNGFDTLTHLVFFQGTPLEILQSLQKLHV